MSFLHINVFKQILLPGPPLICQFLNAMIDEVLKSFSVFPIKQYLMVYLSQRLIFKRKFLLILKICITNTIITK